MKLVTAIIKPSRLDPVLDALKEAGATILPAIPSFYSRPQTIEQLSDTVVHRILDHLGMPSSHAYRWG